MLLAAASAILTLALADCDDITATAAGDLFLACHSPSDKFKVPVAGQKAGKNDEMDGYVIRLGKDAHEVVYVTRMGGSGYDLASRVAIDARGNAWVAGFTKSADFAVTADAWQKTYGGGDGFVQRGPDKRVTFGGSGEEKLTGLAHHKGKLWAAGYTRSNDWKALRGGSDAFAVRLNARTLAIEKTEYFGGSGDDPAWGIAVNKRGRVFIAGQTSSHDLPGAGSGYQRANRGEVDSFIARIGGGATYFGGTAKDEAGYDGQNIAIDAQGNVGWRASLTRPTFRPKGHMGEAAATGSLPSSRRLCRRFCLRRTRAARPGNWERGSRYYRRAARR